VPDVGRRVLPWRRAARASHLLRSAAVAVLVAIATVAISASTADASPDAGWWQSRSVEERQGIVNQYYGAAGQPMPYPAQASIASGALTHLRETTPDESRGALGTQFAKDGSAVALLPALERWVPRLARYGPPPVLAATVVIQIPAVGKWLYSHWVVDVSDPPSQITVQGARYAPPGYNIYYGATSRGEWLLTGRIDDQTYNYGMRWFESPCPYSGLPTPPGARLRTNVPTTAHCRYPIDHYPWYQTAPIYVDYPYLTDEDLRLDDYPILTPDGTLPRDYSTPGEPTPAPAQTEPLLEDLLERDDHTELRRRLLVALATERILQNNSDAVNSGDLDNERARMIADACVAQAADTPGMQSADCGRRDLPMFVGGQADYPDATDHIKRALEYQPAWFKLRYYNRPESERDWRTSPTLLPETDDPGTPCAGRGQQPDPAATACDEFPFFKTEEGAMKDSQGAPHSVGLIPHLKLVSAHDNSGSGGAYGSGLVRRCAMEARRSSAVHGDGQFLVVAVSSELVPTFGFCNGPNP
jgi:hypothetical protein